MHWIVGDIHGMLRPLERLVEAVAQEDATAHFVFVGDYVNRGPDSKGVITRLLALRQATFLRGNHDDIFDELINGECYACIGKTPDRQSAFATWIQSGLAETLESYGIDQKIIDQATAEPTSQHIDQCISGIPESHRRFIRALQPCFESNEFFVAHGYWNPDDADGAPTIAASLKAEPKLQLRLLWSKFTDADLQRPKAWRRTGYFGHTPVTKYEGVTEPLPIHGPKIVLIDTGAKRDDGRLTAVCAETGAVLQTSHDGSLC